VSSIIKGRFVRQVQPGAELLEDGCSPAAALPASARPRAAHARRLEVLRVGERIQALELTCSCGEVTLVELDYPEDSPSETAS
jgi:hypothetical protein